MLTLESTVYRSPIGLIEIACSGKGIVSIAFSDGEGEGTEMDPSPLMRACLLQVREYFEGSRRAFDSLPLAMAGTDFSLSVWERASEIPFGETRTYGDLAAALGDGQAARAVGTALGRNKLALLIPCHRIIPASGGYGGYAWGEERKKWLLAHECASNY